MPIARSNSRVLRVVPIDLTWHSSSDEAREWISMTCAEAGALKSMREDGVVTAAELTHLVRHLKQRNIPFVFLDSADEPSAIAKHLIKLADLDGDSALSNQEFTMLWQLCVHGPPNTQPRPARSHPTAHASRVMAMAPLPGGSSRRLHPPHRISLSPRGTSSRD